MKYLLMILFIPCLLFSQKVYDVKAYPFNAKGDGVTDDRLAIQKAIDTAYAHGGQVLLPSGTFKFSDTLRIRSNTVLAGAGKYSTILKQTTLNKNGLNIRGGSVTIKDLSIIGTNDTTAKQPDLNTTPSDSLYVGVYCSGDSAQNRYNIKLDNVLIRNFDYGINCYFNSGFTFQDGIIDSVLTGIMGGTGNPNCQNDTSMSWRITDSYIRCTYGWNVWSRPIAMPFHAGGVMIEHNTLRGGGMSYENVASSASYSDKHRIIIQNNDCDAAISGGDVISGNVMDRRNAPSGRNYHATFYQAIEPFKNAVVSGNIVRHFINGVGADLHGVIVSGNEFIECGSDTMEGMGGIITILPEADTSQDVIISNNIFKGTQGTVFEIRINGDATDTLSGIMISGNQSYDGDYPFLYIRHAKTVLITGNVVKNSCSGMNTTSASAFWESGYVDATYNNNDIINDLTGGYGIYYAYINYALSVQGFTRVTNPRSGSVFYDEPTNITCPIYLLNDQVRYYIYNRVSTIFFPGSFNTLSSFADSSGIVASKNMAIYGELYLLPSRNNIIWKPNGVIKWQQIVDPINNFSMRWFNQPTDSYKMDLDSLGNLTLWTGKLKLPNGNDISGESDYVNFSKGITLGTDYHLGVAYGGTGVGATLSEGVVKANTGSPYTTIAKTTSADYLGGDLSFHALTTINITNVTTASDTLFFTVGGVQYFAPKRP